MTLLTVEEVREAFESELSEVIDGYKEMYFGVSPEIHYALNVDTGELFANVGDLLSNTPDETYYCLEDENEWTLMPSFVKYNGL